MCYVRTLCVRYQNCIVTRREIFTNMKNLLNVRISHGEKSLGLIFQ